MPRAPPTQKQKDHMRSMGGSTPEPEFKLAWRMKGGEMVCVAIEISPPLPPIPEPPDGLPAVRTFQIAFAVISLFECACFFCRYDAPEAEVRRTLDGASAVRAFQIGFAVIFLFVYVFAGMTHHAAKV